MDGWMCGWMDVCMSTYINIYNVYIYIYAYLYTRLYMYIYTHTYVCGPPKKSGPSSMLSGALAIAPRQLPMLQSGLGSGIGIKQIGYR